MSKRDELLGTSDSAVFYDLNEGEKQELAALLALVDQARLAQDLIYTRLVQSIAQRYELSESTIEIDMNDVYANGVEGAKLKAKKVETPEEDKELDEEPTQETSSKEA